MGVIKEGMKWPIQDAYRYKLREHFAWFSGEGEILANFYNDANLMEFLDFINYKVANRNRFWARQIRNNSDYFLHVPVANDISETSSSFLFSESPIIRFSGLSKEETDGPISNEQKNLDEMLTEMGFYAKILEAAEIQSAFGGVFITVKWDEEISEYPILEVLAPEKCFPTFRYGKLKSLQIVHDVTPSSESSDGNKYRLVEEFTKGELTSTLYRGTSDTIGQEVELTDLDSTKDIEQSVFTGDVMAAFYVPNMLPNKILLGSPYGRSDYQGQETLMDSLDEVFSAWMIDVQFARAKIHAPSQFFDGENKDIDIDKTIYEVYDIDPTALTDPFHETQFDIRAEQFEKTCLNLLDRIITSAGYSPQSFGLNIQGRAESGTALNIRERKSFSTNGKKEGYWEPELKAMVKAICVISGLYLGKSFTTDLKFTVAFADGISNNMSEISASIKTLSDAKALSTDTKVRMAHPEWTDAEVKAEVEKIMGESSVPVPENNLDTAETSYADQFKASMAEGDEEDTATESAQAGNENIEE